MEYVTMICNKLRINDVVRLTGISRNTLYRYMRNGSIEYLEVDGIRYIEQNSVDALLADKLSSNKDSAYQNNESEICKTLHIIAGELTQIRTLLEKNSVTVARTSNSNPVCKPDTKKIQSSTSGVSQNVTTANTLREIEAYNRVVEVLELYQNKGSAMPLPKDMAVEAGVSTSTFRKHQRVWQSKTS